MYDSDANTNSTNIKIQVCSNNTGDGFFTDNYYYSAAKTAGQRTQVINLDADLGIPFGCFKAEFSASTTYSPETCFTFYGYQY